MKRIRCGFLAFILALTAFCGSAQAAPANSPSALLSVALSQLDYEEGAQGYSMYGKWYGVPNGDWCDMFVSWCANEAGVPTSVLPKSAGCTTHVRLFSKIGPYYLSAARGGTYIPQQGDIIFFYNYPEYPKGDVVRHVGIVLCVENGYVFTVEGNTVTNRLDYPFYGAIDELRDFDLQPQDYVAVKRYPLDEPQIHGYASPNYGDKSALPYDGWVDLGKYEPLRDVFDTLAAQSIMAGTSSYTFSPRYGMSRGEFLAALVELCGLEGWDEGTEPFEDVPEDSAYYNGVMTARAAGLILGSGANEFFPDLYISGSDAQAILSRALAYVGLEDRTFAFSEGDYSYLLTPYTIRADLAKALYDLLCEMETPGLWPGDLLFRGEPLEWPVLSLDGSGYVPAQRLKELLSHREAAVDAEEENAQPPVEEPVRVFLSHTRLENGDISREVPAFWYRGTEYVMLRPAAELFGMNVAWNGEDQTITLF